ncbi:MAG TPA: DUF3108 domain-containing protein [Paucimonas sp.]|nr:DUF3108 domain-containing protein [Paucimonas sp.]
MQRHLATALLAFSTLAASAQTADHPAIKHPFQLPPSANLHYAILARQGGLTLNGNALLSWSASAGSYAIKTETRAMLVGKILEADSSGSIDGYGLAPAQAIEKRFRKAPSTTTFDRDSQTIRFTESTASYPLKGGEQDRTSAIWQLISVARAAPDKIRKGAEWVFFVAGRRDAERWTFRVLQRETIRTALGEIDTLHLSKAPPPDSRGQKLDIWLAPALEWYPVRLRFTDEDGDFVEQSLQEITRKAP